LHGLIHNPVFQTDYERAFALYWILIDKRTPYFRLSEGLKMTQEDWDAIGKTLVTEQARVRFILSSIERFDQRSEEADLLLTRIVHQHAA